MFYPEQKIIRPGIQYYIKAGTRRPVGDLLLGFKTEDWYFPPIEHTLICAALKYQVEENNYPRNEGYEGGGRLLRAIGNACCGDGWESQAKEIAEEAKRAAERRNQYIQGILSL